MQCVLPRMCDAGGGSIINTRSSYGIRIGPVRFDERDVETESRVVDCDAARRKGRQQLG